MKRIELTHGKHTLVDDEDYEWLNQWNWNLRKLNNGHEYAGRTVNMGNNKYKTILMHRLILGTTKKMKTDHANHNTLDNRKKNLRICSTAQNRMNAKKHKVSESRYKGVRKSLKKWRAHIKFNGILINLGTFNLEKEAAIAYDIKAKELFGEFAYLNFKGVM